MLDWVVADLRVRVYALAYGGSGLQYANPRREPEVSRPSQKSSCLDSINKLLGKSNRPLRLLRITVRESPLVID